MKRFGAFDFDTQERTLWHGPLKVAMTRKAREVLGCLVEAGGRWVSKDEILKRVWPGTHVHPDNIKVLVREIRVALHDDSRNPQFIRSEKGRGYVFIAPISDIPQVSISRAVGQADSSPVHSDPPASGEPLNVLVKLLADLVRDLVTQELRLMLRGSAHPIDSPRATSRGWTAGSVRDRADVIRWPRLARDLNARPGAHHHGRFRN